MVDASITAGCSIAKTLLLVLTYRAMVRVGSLSTDITLRVFIDDFGTQWMGDEPLGVRVLNQAIDLWESLVSDVMLVDAPDKEALLVSNQKLLKFVGGAKATKIKKWHLYLGFDIFSGSAWGGKEKSIC